MAETGGNTQFTVAEVRVPFVADVESLKQAQDDFDKWIEGVPDKITRALEPMLDGLKEALETATKLGDKLAENNRIERASASSESGEESKDGGLQALVSQEELQLVEIRRIATGVDDLLVKVTELVDNGDR